MNPITGNKHSLNSGRGRVYGRILMAFYQLPHLKYVLIRDTSVECTLGLLATDFIPLLKLDQTKFQAVAQLLSGGVCVIILPLKRRTCTAKALL